MLQSTSGAARLFTLAEPVPLNSQERKRVDGPGGGVTLSRQGRI
ncbi:MAG: hypothetical protein JWR80_8959 [Bradyrhizobium sp.]|nr:hypothetical protein [Bradyrhizobium sp.]